MKTTIIFAFSFTLISYEHVNISQNTAYFFHFLCVEKIRVSANTSIMILDPTLFSKRGIKNTCPYCPPRENLSPILAPLLVLPADTHR